MKNTIDNILKTWHKHFELEENQYSEFEPSDIEYFVGCMLYNHFAFEKALDTMKTIDLSYDFLSNCGDEYNEIKSKIESFSFKDDLEKLDFLQKFIRDSKLKYNDDELYLLNRLEKHIQGVLDRTLNNEESKKVEFVTPIRSNNPLLR